MDFWCLFCAQKQRSEEQTAERRRKMVDLFAGIPEENIIKSLDWISQNLDKVGLEGGHTLRRHTDIQVRALQFRLKEEDVRFATSFWDAEIAAAVVLELLQKNYQAEIRDGCAETAGMTWC